MKAKAEDFKAELEAYRSKGGNYNPEDYPIETVYEETVEQLDVTGRENKNLAEEIKVLLDKFCAKEHSIHELDNQKKAWTERIHSFS